MVKEAGCTGVLQWFLPAQVLNINFTYHGIKSAIKFNKFLTQYIYKILYIKQDVFGHMEPENR